MKTRKHTYQLLRNAFSQPRQVYAGVALIGLRGGGKTTLGARLAAYCDVPFIRLRKVIAQLAGMEWES